MGQVVSFLKSSIPSNVVNFISDTWGNPRNKGKRDYYKEYDYLEKVTYADSLHFYKRSPFAKRLVDIYPDTIWSKKLTIKSSTTLEASINGEYNDDDELISEGLDQKYNIYSALNTVDKLSKIGKFAVLVVGINDGKALHMPISKSNSKVKRTITFLQAYGYNNVNIVEYDENTNSSNFGKPLLYEISAFKNKQPVKVHYTRVLHIVDNILDNPIEGIPLMENLNNTLRDELKVVGGSAEIFFLNSRKGLIASIEGLNNKSDVEKAALGKNFTDFYNGLTRVLFVDGTEVTDLGSNFIDPEPIIRPLIQELCSAGKVPESVLIGNGKSNDTSLQDRNTMANNIEQEQFNRSEPRIFRPFIKLLQYANVLEDGVYEIIWPSSYSLNLSELSEIAAKQARSFLSLSTGASITGESLLSGKELHHIASAGDARLATTRDINIEILSKPDKNIEANKEDGTDNTETGNNATAEQGTTDKID